MCSDCTRGGPKISGIIKKFILNIRTSLKLLSSSKYWPCDRMQRSLQCSHCWKHCLKSSTEMLSKADSDSLRISATLAKRLHFKTCFIRGYKHEFTHRFILYSFFEHCGSFNCSFFFPPKGNHISHTHVVL